MKTKQQLREHLHTYAQIGVAVGLLMGAIDLWGEDLQAKESALLDQVLSEEMSAYEVFEQLSTMAEEASDNTTPTPGKNICTAFYAIRRKSGEAPIAEFRIYRMAANSRHKRQLSGGADQRHSVLPHAQFQAAKS